MIKIPVKKLKIKAKVMKIRATKKKPMKERLEKMNMSNIS
jgi:hypothetical protein